MAQAFTGGRGALASSAGCRRFKLKAAALLLALAPLGQPAWA